MTAKPSSNLSAVFAKLKPLLEAYSAKLDCITNTPEVYYLNTRHLAENNKPMFFASVQIKKAYVSVYLMPVYCHPELLDDISPELQKRMQGKSCFNFKSVDAELFQQLKTLVAKSAQCYQALGYM